MRQPGQPRTEPGAGFPTAARAFNAFTSATALSLFAYSLISLPSFSVSHLTLTLTLALGTLVTLLLATNGNRHAVVRSSQFGLSIDAVWVFAAILLLPFPFMILATALARSSSAFVSPPAAGRGSTTRLMSSISITAISGFVASVIHQQINGRPPGGMDSTPREVIAVLVSAVAFSLLSHLLTGIAFSLASSHRLRDQRAGTGILIEVALLCHGGLVAWAWTQSPAIFFLGMPTLVIVQRALMHDRLEARANRDAKTGVGSIGWWHEAANQAVARAGPQRQVGFLVLDLDHFKRVNDTYGHLNGDRVLKAVADVLQAEVRADDKVGRFGGEEFVILLPGASPQVVYVVAERLRSAIQKLAINLDGPIAGVTVSIGGAVYPLNGETVTDLIQHADRNLYDAKRSGRDKVVMDGITGPATSALGFVRP
jgi:diguanylate cyclase (GGDEF)-like protein